MDDVIDNAKLSTFNISALALSNYDKLCDLAYALRNERSIVASVTLQAFFGIASLTLLFVLFRSTEMRRLYSILTLDLKIIIFAGAFCYTMGSLNSASLFAYKSILMIFNFSPCNYVWSGFSCYWAQKFYASVCLRCYLICHGSLLVERVYSTFFKKYFHFEGALGLIAGFIIAIVTPIYMSSPGAKIEYGGDRAYCLNSSGKMDRSGIINVYMLIGIDYFTTACDCILLLWNRHQIKTHKKKSVNAFNLNESYSLREAQISMSFIFPLSIIHSLTYSIQLYAYLAFMDQLDTLSIEDGVFQYELVNFSRILGNFLLFSSIFLFVHIRKCSKSNMWAQRRKVAADDHFNQFRKIIA